MILEAPAWLEPDLCALEDWETFRKPLVQLIATGLGQRVTLVAGLSEAWRRKLDRDLKGRSGQRSAAPALQMLSRESDLSLEILPDLLRERLENLSEDDPPSLYFVHDMAWTQERHSVEEILEYLTQMAALRLDHPLQTVHVYSPQVFPPEALWRLMRGHRAVWTGETTCENFYFVPQPQPSPPQDFGFAEDLKRNLEHLKRQTRIRAELVGSVVQTESLMEERVRELQALNRLAQILAHSQDLDEILHEALVRVIELLEMDAGAIYVGLDDGSHAGEAPTRAEMRVCLPGGSFEREALLDFHHRLAGGDVIPPGGRISWASDLREAPSADLPPETGIRSYLAAPLKFSGTAVGVLEVIGAESHAFSLQEIHMVDVIGGQIGVAVENARLYQRHLQSETAEMQLREELSHTEKLASLGALVSRIVHEVNTPLEAALAGVEGVEDASLAEPLRRRLHAVRDQIARATRVLSNLETLVGDKRGARVPVQLNDIVLGCVEQRVEALRAQGVELALRLGDSLPATLGDAAQLQRVFLNLIDNALQAMRAWPGGKHVTISTLSDKGEIVAAVEDDGPGIPEADLPMVFEPFYTSRGSEAVGAGLGLAICRAIVQTHGGSMQVHSSPGKRTTFTVSMPVLKGKNTPEEPVALGSRKKRSTSARRTAGKS